MAAEFCTMGAVEVGRRYRARDLSPVEATRAVLERIGRIDPELNACIEIFADRALAAARAAETQLATGIDLSAHRSQIPRSSTEGAIL